MLAKLRGVAFQPELGRNGRSKCSRPVESEWRILKALRSLGYNPVHIDGRIMRNHIFARSGIGPSHRNPTPHIPNTKYQCATVYLVVFLEANSIRALTEAPAAHVQAISANDTTAATANTATTLECAFSVTTGVSWDEVGRHLEKDGQTAIVTNFLNNTATFLILVHSSTMVARW